MINAMKRAAFLDRDGVINQKAPEDGYILRWEEFHLLPDVAEAISLLNHAGLLVVVVTNQRAVSRGLITVEGLEEIHRKMRDELASAGARIDAIYYCPHGSDDSCACRKPAPGMLRSAAREHGIDLASSWMVGDTDSDIVAGRSAGCKTIRIARKMESADTTADFTADSLFRAARTILAAR